MSTECTCTALRIITRKVTSLYDAALEPLGLTVAQYSLLRKIERAGAPSMTELGRLADLDRSTVGRNVRLLEKLGLVSLGSGGDQREASVRLSRAGLARLEDAREPWARAQEAIEAKIGGEAAAMLRSLAASL